MGLIFSLLGLICAIVSIVCWIMVLIKIFKAGETVHGIIGIICGLWAFIFGWMKADEYGIKQVMLAWTAAMIVGFLFNVLSAVFAGGTAAVG